MSDGEMCCEIQVGFWRILLNLAQESPAKKEQSLVPGVLHFSIMD
jgi:hypothetical protein